ncbi:hypothetical protein HT574_06870 [Parageobacillus sp. VR-IP]|uniref:hypothetical protein n=1 Tax=Parageobacillus sp. VR-IP TaxID=2742205 RepID=UPI001582ADA7|nr:hypothetical protein [Parageobacillus sp. VR-IP]NUK29819.1 hypothetical protein [Parageobacillus sp. VR-IP]
MMVNIYLADLMVRERKGSKRKKETYRIFIKEMKNPFSIRLKTIAPTNFTDSLRFLKSEENRDRFLGEDTLFRTIICSSDAQLYFVFKCVNQLYMFIVKLDLQRKKFEITLYEWNQLQQKYLRVHTNELLAMERKLIYEILQSIYIFDHKRISYLYTCPARKNNKML